jgi:hypothetical protein
LNKENEVKQLERIECVFFVKIKSSKIITICLLKLEFFLWFFMKSFPLLFAVT